MNSIKNIYQHACKCDDEQKLKDFIYAAILSNPEEVTDNSPNVPRTSTPSQKPSARKSLCLLTNELDVKPNTEKCRIVAAKSKLRAMKVGTNHCTKKIKQKGLQKSTRISSIICMHG